MNAIPRVRFVPPLDPDAEPVCRLTPEWARRRKEPPDRLLDQALSQEYTGDGALFRFPRSDAMWKRIAVFIDEERECCPFFAFEQREEEDAIVLRIFRPAGTSD